MYYPEEMDQKDFVLSAISFKIPDDCSCVAAVEVEFEKNTKTKYLDFNKEAAILFYDDIVNMESRIFDIKIYVNPQLTSNDEYEEPSPVGLSTLCARFEIDRMDRELDINTVLCKLPFIKKLHPSLISRPDRHIIDLMWCLNELIPVKTQRNFINKLMDKFTRKFRFMNGKYSFIPMKDLSHMIDLPTCIYKYDSKGINPVYVLDMFDDDDEPRIKYYSVWELSDAIDTDDDIDY